MNLNVAGVDHQPFEIGFGDQFFQQSLPEAFVAPAAKAAMGVFPVPIIRRQVPPGSAGTQDPENGIEKKPVVFGLTAPESLLSGQMGFEEFPGSVVEVVAAVDGRRDGGSLGEVRRLFSIFRKSSIS